MKPFFDDKYYRLPEIVRPGGKFPISASAWWAGVKSGQYPRPIKLGARTSVWHGAQLNMLVAQQPIAAAEDAA